MYRTINENYCYFQFLSAVRIVTLIVHVLTIRASVTQTLVEMASGVRGWVLEQVSSLLFISLE